MEIFGSFGPLPGIAQFVKLYHTVLFALVDLQLECMGQVSEPMNICLGKKSLNW